MVLWSSRTEKSFARVFGGGTDSSCERNGGYKSTERVIEQFGGSAVAIGFSLAMNDRTDRARFASSVAKGNVAASSTELDQWASGRQPRCVCGYWPLANYRPIWMYRYGPW